MNYSDYLKVKKEYDEQRILEKYQATRSLPRPRTKRIHVLIFSLIYFATLALAFVLFDRIGITVVKILLYSLFPIIFSELYLRFVGIKMVECYQHYATEETRRRCLCVPSCSEYAILCFKRYELVYALLKIRRRLYVTCKGYLYVLDFPYKKGCDDTVE